MLLNTFPLLAFALLVLSGNTLGYPRHAPNAPGFSPCPVGSGKIEKCITNSLNAYIPILSEGWGEEVPPLDPLMVPSIETDYDDGNVTLSLKLKNIVIVGLASTKVYSVRAKSLDEGKLELMCKTPKITATGIYHSEGAVITFPLHSSGPFNLTLGDLTSHFIIHLEGVGDHIQISEIGLNVMPAQIDVQGGSQLDKDNNLGNLGDALNVYLSENSFELYELVRPRLMKYFSEMFKAIVNSIFSGVPTQNIFPNLDLRK